MLRAVGYSNSSLNPQCPALRPFNRLAQWISIPGHGRCTEFVTRQWLHVSDWLSTCMSQAIVVADNVYRSQWSQVYCRRQYVSVDAFHNPLSRTTYIDSYPWAINPQWLLMDSLHSLLWEAMAIDRHIAQSIVTGNCHRWTRLTIYFLRECLSIDSSITHPLSPTISIDGYLSNILSPTICIDGNLPQSIVADIIYR